MHEPDPQAAPQNLQFEDWERLRMARLDRFVQTVPRFERWLLLAGLSIATGAEIAGRTATGVLLPDLQGNAGATIDELAWVMIAYNTGYICSLGVSAGIVRSFGIRWLWLVCLSLYGLGTILTFFSHSLTPLLIARGIAGLGGGVFIVRSVLFLRELFPKSEMAWAVTMFNVIVFSIKGVWPVLMGAISDGIDWNAAYLSVLPLVAVSFFIIRKFMPRRYEPAALRPPADYCGVALLLTSLITLQVSLSRGERDMWFQSDWIWLLVLTSGLCFAAFLWWEFRKGNENPIVNLRTILSQQTYTPAIGLVLLGGAFMGAALYVIPQYLRIIEPYNAQQAAMFYVVDTIGLFIGVSAAVWFGVPRFGGALTAATGVALFGCTNLAFVYMWTGATPGADVAILLLADGLGVGLLLVGMSLLSTGSLERRFQNEAATSYFFLRQLGASIGVSLAAVLIDQRMTVHSSRLLDTANRLDPTAGRFLEDFARVIATRGNGTSVPVPGNYELFRGLVATQARLLAFIDICFCLAVAAVIGLMMVAVTRWRQLQPVPEDHSASMIGH
jgi:MFS transporter, DHA2 family, multidrug resistance protein